MRGSPTLPAAQPGAVPDRPRDPSSGHGAGRTGGRHAPALAGKTLAEDDARLNLFAVGDDDQNIYAWKGASVRFIRRFTQDYHAKEEYLVENYRSSGYIIDAANRCIDGAAERLKRDYRLRIDASRLTDPPGWASANHDGAAEGKVQILHLRGGQLSQALAAVEELKRLSDLDSDWDWRRCAIIARNWADLDPARSAGMVHGIRPVPPMTARARTATVKATTENPTRRRAAIPPEPARSWMPPDRTTATDPAKPRLTSPPKSRPGMRLHTRR